MMILKCSGSWSESSFRRWTHFLYIMFLFRYVPLWSYSHLFSFWCYTVCISPSLGSLHYRRCRYKKQIAIDVVDGVFSLSPKFKKKLNIKTTKNKHLHSSVGPARERQLVLQRDSYMLQKIFVTTFLLHWQPPAPLFEGQISHLCVDLTLLRVEQICMPRWQLWSYILVIWPQIGVKMTTICNQMTRMCGFVFS